jgi:hypothetical protein
VINQHGGIFPTIELLERFAACMAASSGMSEVDLASLLVRAGVLRLSRRFHSVWRSLQDKFIVSSQIDKQFVMCRHEEMKVVFCVPLVPWALCISRVCLLL